MNLYSYSRSALGPRDFVPLRLSRIHPVNSACCSFYRVSWHWIKAKIARANILKISLYSSVFIENFLTPGRAGLLAVFAFLRSLLIQDYIGETLQFKNLRRCGVLVLGFGK
jgi:hypothetical protein